MDISIELGNYLKEARIANKISLRKVEQQTGIGYSFLSMIENGKRNVTPNLLKQLSSIYNINYIDLFEKAGYIDLIEKEKLNSSASSAVVFVYGTIPAGIPMECIEDIIDTEEISLDMLKGNKQYFGLKIKGNSMSPDYLDGDTIILQQQNDCESGDDCVVMVNGNEGTFKRVFKNEEQQTITLQPLNTSIDENGKPLYEPITFTKEQIENLPVKIIGVFEELRRKKKRKN